MLAAKLLQLDSAGDIEKREECHHNHVSTTTIHTPNDSSGVFQSTCLEGT